MEASIMQSRMERFQVVAEDTSYLELRKYTDSSYDTCREKHLSNDEELADFVSERGRFELPTLENGIELRHSVRLILQREVADSETFAPNTISLHPSAYRTMIREMRLPSMVLETTASLSVLCWFRYVEDEAGPHLQMIFRNAAVGRRDRPYGWELLLSHSILRSETTGFAKWTANSVLTSCIGRLRDCTPDEIAHPLLLPALILAEVLSARHELHQQDARQTLRSIERALSKPVAGGIRDRGRDLEQIQTNITQCYNRVLEQPPDMWRNVIARLEGAARCFWEHLPAEKKTSGIARFHADVLARMDFHRARLDGVESYVNVTRERLELQRGMAQFITAGIAQEDAKLNLRIAGEQRRLAHASKRDSEAMKGLSLLGAAFLPGTLLASIFSMTFFNFQPDNQPVSPRLWIYFAITAPLTGLAVAGLLLWERARQQRWAREDAEIDRSIADLEKRVVAELF